MEVSLTGRGIPTTMTRLFPSRQLRCAAARSLEVTEIKVCVNRSCGRQGSRETLDVLSGMAPHGVSIASCGCLGRCGDGPNLVLLPGGGIVSHCGTPARAAQLFANIFGEEFHPLRNLEAMYLRKMGEAELEKGNPSQAAALLSQAIELIPSGGLHYIYKSRSAAKLGMGDNDGALKDAKEACKISPHFPQECALDPQRTAQEEDSQVRTTGPEAAIPTVPAVTDAYICQGDAFLAMGDLVAAQKVYATALDFDPSIRRSNSFKARLAKVKEKLLVAAASS